MDIRKYKVYKEDFDGSREFLGYASASNCGSGIFDLYADEVVDGGEILIIEMEAGE